MSLFKKKLVKPVAPEFNKEFYIDKLLMERATPTYDISNINLSVTRLPRIFNYGFIKFCEKINWIDCLKYKTNLLL